MRLRAIVPTTLSLLAFASAAHATGNGPWMPQRGEYYSEVSAGKEFADSFFDSAGAKFGVPNSGRLETKSLQFYNEIGWKKRVSLVLAAPVLSVTANRPDFAQSRTETGFGDLILGFKFKLKEGNTAAAIQAEWQAPLGYQTNTFPALGGGKQVARESFEIGTALPKWNAFAQGSAFYASYFEPIRSYGGATALAGVWFGSSLLVTGHYSMFTVFGGSDLENDDIGGQVVGPELRYRVDDRLDVFAGSNHTASGKNVPHSDAYYVGMAFRQTKLHRLQGLLGNKTRP